jgi:hypothetical protein
MRHMPMDDAYDVPDPEPPRPTRKALKARIRELEKQQDWVYEHLIELNTSNYTHDDVYEANAAVVEVLAAIKPNFYYRRVAAAMENKS